MASNPTVRELAVLIEERDRRMEERDRRLGVELDAIRATANAAIQTSAKAIDKSEASIDERLRSLNGFRAAMADKDNLFMPRAEARAEISRLAEKIDVLNSHIDRIEGKSEGGAKLWGIIVSGVVVAGGLVTLLARLL